MAALVCDICGGKLQGKPGGIFECDSCGMEYSTEWAKAKIQEIKGTVKVEGTVAVQGTVKVEGAASADSLLKRGQMALEDKNWDEAKRCFEQVLDMNPEIGAAYWGLAVVDVKGSGMLMVCECLHETPKNIQRARQFADAQIKKKLTSLDKAIAAEKARREKKRIAQEQRTKAQRHLAVGPKHTVGLKTDGTVVAVGKNDLGQCIVGGWTDIVAVSAGTFYTVGLKSDGTVIATNLADHKAYYYGQCDFDGWTDIVDISAGKEHTVGLKSDGTVVAVGNKGYGRCNVSDWTDIVAVFAGINHTVGLKSNGTVIAVGNNDNGQCNVGGWSDIVTIATGVSHTVGLKSDGTVVAVGKNDLGQCNVAGWNDIVAISASLWRTVGLKSDGTVVAVGLNTRRWNNVVSWPDGVAITEGFDHVVALKSDGTVVTVGSNGEGPCDVNDWKLFHDYRNLDEEKVEARRRYAEESARKRAENIASLEAEKAAIEAELPTIKGIFAGGKRKKLEERLAEINSELKKLGE